MSDAHRPVLLLAAESPSAAGVTPGALREEAAVSVVGPDGRDEGTGGGGPRPQVVLADLGEGDLGGGDAVERVRKQCPGARVLLVADRVTPESARAALAAGASGCLRRGGPLTELLAAIRTVLGGGTYVSAEMLAGGRAIVSPPSEEPLAGLSRRQQEILRLLVAGLNPKAIAARIGISHRTVEFHKYQAMTRLGCKTFPEMIRLAVENGIKPG